MGMTRSVLSFAGLALSFSRSESEVLKGEKEGPGGAVDHKQQAALFVAGVCQVPEKESLRLASYILAFSRKVSERPKARAGAKFCPLTDLAARARPAQHV